MTAAKMPDVLSDMLQRVDDEPTGSELRRILIERGIIRPRVVDINTDGLDHRYDEAADARPCLEIGPLRLHRQPPQEERAPWRRGPFNRRRAS